MDQDWIFKSWMTPVLHDVVEVPSMPTNSLMLVGVVPRAVVLGPGESINDLTPRQLIERAIDWKETSKRSALITNIGKEESR